MRARTQSKPLWLAGGAVLAVLIVLVGWFGVIAPELSASAAANEQAQSARMQNVALEAKNATLKDQNDDAAALRASLAAALAALPSDGGLAEFTRQLSAQATATSVLLTGISVGATNPVAEPTGTTGTTTTDTGTTDAGSTTGATVAPTAGLLEMEINVTANGLGADLRAFVNEVQVTGPRRALMTAVQLVPGDNGGSGNDIEGPSILNLSMNIFTAPLTPDAQAALDKLLSGN